MISLRSAIIAAFASALLLCGPAYAAPSNEKEILEACLNAEKKPDEAIGACTTAIASRPKGKLSPGNAFRIAVYYSARALAYNLKGKNAQALSDINNALSFDQSAGPYGIRGLIYEKLGQREKAIADYRASLRLDPKLKEAREGLKRLTSGPAAKGASDPDKTKIIAGDGKSAVHCVRLQQVSRGNSSLSGGGTVLANNCGATIEVAWCHMDGECQKGFGNHWTLGPGGSYPVKSGVQVNWATCFGANTVMITKGTQYRRFACRKPQK